MSLSIRSIDASLVGSLSPRCGQPFGFNSARRMMSRANVDMGACTGKEEKKAAPAKGKPALKVLIIGQANVGKTSVLKKYCDNEFPAQEDPTLQNDAKSKKIDLGGGNVETLQIWDTAGSEKYRQLTSSFYTNCKGIVVMFDVTDQASFDALSNWFDEVATYSSKTRSSSVADPSRYPQLVLCGNKIDIADKRVVSADKAYTLATERGLQYLETSAATGHNIDQLFVTLTKLMTEEESILGN